MQITPLPKFRQMMIDWMELMRRKHTIHALVEVDVTDARRAIREYRAATGEPLSLTAFTVASLAKAVGEDTRVQAYRMGRSRMITFDEVDVAVMVERELEGAKVPVGVVIRSAESKPLAEIQDEIHSGKVEALPWAGLTRWLPVWLLVPAPLRRGLLAWFVRDPRRRKRFMGTVSVSALGMFGSGTAWAVPLSDVTLMLTVGGIARKPGVTRGSESGRGERVEIREVMSLTISMDHDVIDGAPAARFIARLKEIIEEGLVLRSYSRVQTRLAPEPVADGPVRL